MSTEEMVELMVEVVRSKWKTIRVAGNDFPQAVVKSRLLKLDREHICFVFDYLFRIEEPSALYPYIEQYRIYRSRVNHFSGLQHGHHLVLPLSLYRSTPPARSVRNVRIKFLSGHRQ